MAQSHPSSGDHRKLITVFGGSGFVGRYVVRALAKRGHRVRVAVRRPDLAFHLQPLGKLGQIRAVQANLRFRDSVFSAAEGADTIINLVGILQEDSYQGFDAIHAFGARVVAEAARSAGADLIHMSAIGADINSHSAYGSSKGEGEAAVFETMKKSIIMRPSIIFGQEDAFFNRFAAMVRLSPVLPLMGSETRFQPIYVGDVARAFACAADGLIAGGKIYELGGSDILTLKQCLEIMLTETNRNCLLIDLPWPLARAFAKLTGWIPGAPITIDQVRMLETDNVVSPTAVRQKRDLAGMGIKPQTLASILPTYLNQYRPHGEFFQRDAS